MSSTKTTTVHKYPWSWEERISIAVFVLAGLFCIYRVVFSTGATGTIILAVVSLGLAVGLFFLGSSRKKSSTLFATVENGLLSVRGNKLEMPNSVTLSSVKRVESRKIGVNETFILEGEKDKRTYVPLRVARKEPLTSDLKTVFTSAILSDDAKTLAKKLS